MKRTLLALAVGSCLVGCQMGGDSEPSKGSGMMTQTAYPLTTCVVSGHELGEMGEPVVVELEGREVRLCCAACEDELRKDPQKFLSKLDAAAAEAKAAAEDAAGDATDDASDAMESGTETLEDALDGSDS